MRVLEFSGSLPAWFLRRSSVFCSHTVSARFLDDIARHNAKQGFEEFGIAVVRDGDYAIIVFPCEDRVVNDYHETSWPEYSENDFTHAMGA